MSAYTHAFGDEMRAQYLSSSSSGKVKMGSGEVRHRSHGALGGRMSSEFAAQSVATVGARKWMRGPE